MRIAVASDHAGFIQKAPIIEHIRSLGHEVVDLGPATDDRVDYPDLATRWAAWWLAVTPTAASSSAAPAWALP